MSKPDRKVCHCPGCDSDVRVDVRKVNGIEVRYEYGMCREHLEGGVSNG